MYRINMHIVIHLNIIELQVFSTITNSTSLTSMHGVTRGVVHRVRRVQISHS